MMPIERSHRTTKSIPLTPLIDVVFMLMIFFILTTNYVDIEALKLAVIEEDTAATSQGNAIKAHEVVLLSSGATFVNGHLVYYGELEDRLEVVFARTPNVPVTVKCEEKVNVQMLVDVLDMVKRTGGEEVNVARLSKAAGE
jgi:biopolymer transport protein ExbD